MNRDWRDMSRKSACCSEKRATYLGSGRRGLSRAVWNLFLPVAVKHLHIYAGRYPSVIAGLSLPLAQAEQGLSGAPYGTS